MAQTTVYLLFKEYVDSSTGPTRPYIHGVDISVGDEDRLNEEINPIIQILSFFIYEHKTVLYDPDNLKQLFYQTEVIPNIYPGLKANIAAQLRKQGATYWTSNPAPGNDLHYHLYDSEVTLDMLGDMARRQSQENNTPCVLVHEGAINTINNQIELRCSNHQTILLQTCGTILSLHRWFSDNRIPKRQYHYNDKHGDANNPSKFYIDRNGVRRKAAQLKTDTQSTNELLKLAIGSDVNSELWYYDVDNTSFIYFENEGDTPQLGFHAYHINKGDENFDNIDIEKLCQVQSDVQKLFRL